MHPVAKRRFSIYLWLWLDCVTHYITVMYLVILSLSVTISLIQHTYMYHIAQLSSG